MQQAPPTQPSPTLSSFAGLLATLASPPHEAAEEEPLWNSSYLGEDVATLSYERALRAHARYRPLDHGVDHSRDRGDRSPIPPAGLGPTGLKMDAGLDSSVEADAAGAAAEAGAAPALSKGIATDRDLRSASVTIRMSKAECARLHRRAAEAGLTVSAYLRSCALEAETLRAQVKQALAELKAGSKGTAGSKGSSYPSSKAVPPLSSPGGEQGSKGTWWRKFFGWVTWLTRRGR
ncbi:MAG: hypothetical protein ABSD59_12560 [Terracidiphilus sp.]|jgi:predicted DNA binding CopG/RHH family protein